MECLMFLAGGIKARIEITRRIWPFMASIGLAYFVTLCLFPGIESEIVSCRLGSWMPVLLMAVFNFMDLIGKVCLISIISSTITTDSPIFQIIASVPYDWSRAELVLMSLARIILVPLMLMCAAPRHSPLIPMESWAFIISATLGLTNGIFGSVPMILAPTKVAEEHKELAGESFTQTFPSWRCHLSF